MKIILLKDVKGKGKKDEIIDVSDGYGNNYLIKNKLGVLYTTGSKKVLDKEIEKRKETEDIEINRCNEIRKKIENKDFVFKVKVGTQDKVFGNVSTKQIADKLKENGFNIDKKCVKVERSIDSLGTHKVMIELHKKVSFFINVVLSK